MWASDALNTHDLVFFVKTDLQHFLLAALRSPERPWLCL